jgi:hypothetical protein
MELLEQKQALGGERGVVRTARSVRDVQQQGRDDVGPPKLAGKVEIIAAKDAPARRSAAAIRGRRPGLDGFRDGAVAPARSPGRVQGVAQRLQRQGVPHRALCVPLRKVGKPRIRKRSRGAFPVGKESNEVPLQRAAHVFARIIRLVRVPTSLLLSLW